MAHIMEKQKKTKPIPQRSIKRAKTVIHLAHASALQNKTRKNPTQNTKKHQTRNKTMSVKSTTACLFFLNHLNNRILSVQVGL